MAAAPRSYAGTSRNVPPKLPMGVRTAATAITSFWFAMICPFNASEDSGKNVSCRHGTRAVSGKPGGALFDECAHGFVMVRFHVGDGLVRGRDLQQRLQRGALALPQ